jgi:putative Ig domain-containing protein
MMNKNLRFAHAPTLRTWACVVVTAVAFSLLVPVAAEAATTTSITLMWDQNTDSVTVGYSVQYGIQSGNYSGSVDVGNATSAVINLPDSTNTYYFAVQAYSATGERSSLSTEVVWTPPAPTAPLPPTLQNPGSTSTTVGSASVILQLVATDPQGLALTYSASNLPPGLSIAAKTGLISGIPTQVGVYNVTAKVTNTAGLSASQTFTWTILALPTTSPISDGGGTSNGGGSGGGNGNGKGGNGNGNGGVGNGNGNGNGGGGGATVVITDPVVTDPVVTDPITAPDQTPPDLSITSPTTAPSYRTKDSKIILTGSAWDDVGVVSVTWTNDRGGSGAAFGTTSWATSPIDLKMGDNIITITASDAAGNVRTVTLTVTRYVEYTNGAN